MSDSSPDQFAFDFSKVDRVDVTPNHAVIRDNHGEFRPEFSDWLSDNIHVQREFERMANRLWELGRRHWAASSLVYYIRLRTALHEKGGEWKINQNNARDLAKLYVLTHPGREKFFEFRLRADTVRCRAAA